MRSALLFVAALLAGCAESPPGSDHPEVPVGFRTLLQQSNAPIFETAHAGTLDERAWNATWARYAEGISPAPPAPFVDFAREQVVVVAIGQYGSGCNDVLVRNVTRGDGELVIRSERYEGESSSVACTAQVVWPAHVVAVADLSPAMRVESERVATTAGWPSPREETPWLERLQPRALESGSFSGIHDDTRLLLRDASAWEALWREHRAAEPVPRVDFATEAVVAVVVHGPTGCAGIRLGQLAYDRVGQIVHVEVVLERAPENVQCFVAFEDVYFFVAVPAREGGARFVDVAE